MPNEECYFDLDLPWTKGISKLYQERNEATQAHGFKIFGWILTDFVNQLQCGVGQVFTLLEQSNKEVEATHIFDDKFLIEVIWILFEYLN
jgi:hypothetical protein